MDQVYVCRTCLKVIENSRYVDLDASDTSALEFKSKLEACVPELTLSVSKNPVMCIYCVNSLNAAYKFKKMCTSTEEKIYEYMLELESDNETINLQYIAEDIKRDESEIENILNESYFTNEENNMIDIKNEPYLDGRDSNFNNNYENEIEAASAKIEIASDKVEMTSDEVEVMTSDEVEVMTSDAVEVMTSDEVEITSDEIETSALYYGLVNSDEILSLPLCSVTLTRLSEDFLKKYDYTNIETTKDVVKSKIRVNHIPQYCKCVICNALVKGKHVRRHVQYHKQNIQDGVMLICYPYNEKTTEPIKLEIDKKTNTTFKRYKCGLCDVSSIAVLTDHMRTHTGEKPFECTICEFCTNRKDTLKKHLRIHAGVVKPKMKECHKCSLCGYRTFFKDKLLKHMKTAHAPECIKINTSELSYKCTVCKFETAIARLLKNHMKNHPGHQLLYKCAYCNYTTKYVKLLKYHTYIHTNEKLFKCASCEYITLIRKDISEHVKIHCVHKTYKCTKCDYATNTRSLLSYHSHKYHK